MEPKIELYQHTKFGGTKTEINTAKPSLAAQSNSASSAKVLSGYWILYEERDYAGIPHFLPIGEYPEYSSLGIIGNDQLSSIRPLPDTGICLFANENFGGEMVVVTGSDTRSFEAKSVIVRSGEWALYKEADGSGTAINTPIGKYPHNPSGFTGGVSVKFVKPSHKGNLLVVSGKEAAKGGTAGALPHGDPFELLDKPSVELIIDASGSMRAAMASDHGPSTRMNIAKDVLKKVVNEDLPNGIPVAFRVFGPGNLGDAANRKAISNSTGNSGVTTLLQPLETLNRATLNTTIDSISPDGYTPIAGSLDQVKSDMASATGSKLVVLLTDGEETCGGDVLKSIKDLRAGGFNVVINIVGFAIQTAELKRTFQDWAEQGGGEYYDAGDSAALFSVINKALRIPYKVLKFPDLNTTLGTGYVNGASVELDPDQAYVVQLNPTQPDAKYISGVSISAGNTTEVVVKRW